MSSLGRSPEPGLRVGLTRSRPPQQVSRADSRSAELSATWRVRTSCWTTRRCSRRPTRWRRRRRRRRAGPQGAASPRKSRRPRRHLRLKLGVPVCCCGLAATGPPSCPSWPRGPSSAAYTPPPTTPQAQRILVVVPKHLLASWKVEWRKLFSDPLRPPVDPKVPTSRPPALTRHMPHALPPSRPPPPPLPPAIAPPVYKTIDIRREEDHRKYVSLGRESDAESEKDGVCGLTVAPHYILDGFSLNINTEDFACAARALGSAKPGAKNGAPGPASRSHKTKG